MADFDDNFTRTEGTHSCPFHRNSAVHPIRGRFIRTKLTRMSSQMIALTIAVTALLLHVVIEKNGIEAALPTAATERKLRYGTPIFESD